MEKKLRLKELAVGYQGEPGAYSEIVALRIGTPKPYKEFKEVFHALVKKKIDCAALPIENSIAGSIWQNIDLLFTHDVKIISETIVPVNHCLLGVYGATIQNAIEVKSHIQALMQCTKLFASYTNLKPIETYDTAGSAKQLSEKPTKKDLVIASERAAEVYNLKIIKRNISDESWNRTRFLILAQSQSKLELSSKSSDQKSAFIFTPKPTKSLYDVLSAIYEANYPILKFDSRPTRKHAFEAFYYVEVAGAFHSKVIEKIATCKMFGSFGEL